MPKPKPPKPWRREVAGQYVSADERFVVDESAPGHWYVTDREQPDELGQPRITGPFASLSQARSEADVARQAPSPVSPLADRLAERPGRADRHSTGSGRPRDRGPARSRTSPSPRPAPAPKRPPEPVVRHAERGDAPGIARLWLGLAERLAAAEPDRFRYPAEDELGRAVADHLANPDPDVATFVVAAGDGIVGFGAVRLLHPVPYPERQVATALGTVRAAVPALAVDAGWRRKGFERRLLEAIEAWAREHGAARISIDVPGDGLQSAALYRGAGYEQAPPAFERALDRA